MKRPTMELNPYTAVCDANARMPPAMPNKSRQAAKQKAADVFHRRPFIRGVERQTLFVYFNTT
jgi:hypothetical protein